MSRLGSVPLHSRSLSCSQPAISLQVLWQQTAVIFTEITAILLSTEVNKDYLDADTTQNFEACDTRRCISVPIVDDSVGEPDEQLSISLGDPSDSRIIASLREGLINIIDRDMSE